MREPIRLKSRARSWRSPEQQFQMRAHERAHVERGETLEQTGPYERHEPWRDQQLRKPGERIMRELALLDGEPQSFAHGRQHARNNFTIIELRQLREACALRDDEAKNVFSARLVDVAHECIENELDQCANGY